MGRGWFSGPGVGVLDARYVNVPGDTMTGALVLDDGAGDSPALSLVGGANDDTANIQLIDNAVAGDSDLAVTLCAADDGSQLLIRDNSPATVAYIDADGNADFIGHAAVGDSANVVANTVLNVADIPIDNAGVIFSVASRVFYSPTANFTATTYGYSGGSQLQTAWTRTGGQLVGVNGFVNIAAGIDARNVRIRAAHFHLDVEDAGSGGGTGVTQGVGAYIETPRVDTGLCSNGYGVQIAQGVVGAGSITTLRGLYVNDINAGTTNWSIYTNAGNVRFGDDVLIGATAEPVANAGMSLVFGDNAADPTPAGNTCAFYGKDVAGTVEAFCVDEAANVTQLSPHDPDTGEWIFYSRNVRTGREVRVNMEEMVRAVEELTGKQFMVERWVQ